MNHPSYLLPAELQSLISNSKCGLGLNTLTAMYIRAGLDVEKTKALARQIEATWREAEIRAAARELARKLEARERSKPKAGAKSPGLTKSEKAQLEAEFLE